MHLELSFQIADGRDNVSCSTHISAKIRAEVKQKECEIWVVIAYELLASRFFWDSYGFRGFKHFWVCVPKIRFGDAKGRGSVFLIMRL
jgi:hypothetical protein